MDGFADGESGDFVAEPSVEPDAGGAEGLGGCVCEREQCGIVFDKCLDVECGHLLVVVEMWIGEAGADGGFGVGAG